LIEFVIASVLTAKSNNSCKSSFYNHIMLV